MAKLVRPISSGFFKSQWEVFGTGHLKFIDDRLVQSDLSTEKSLQCCCHCCYCCYSMKVLSAFHKALATAASVLICLAAAKTVYASQWLPLRRLPSHLQVPFRATVTSHFNHDFISSRLPPPAFLFIMETD